MTERGARRAGNITRRGANSWRIKVGLPKAADGTRRVRYLTIRGSRQDAQKALAAALLETSPVASSRLTVGQYVERWLPGRAAMLSAKSQERCAELVRLQILPFLGHVPIQGLRNQDVAEWHATLLIRGGYGGRPLSRQTVAIAHQVLYRALEDAVRLEIIGRNPCSTVKPPRPAPREARSLQIGQVGKLLETLQAPAHRDSIIRPIAILALATGLRRGEILGLRWCDVDLEDACLQVMQSIEQTKLGGIAVKTPKTKAGRRTISLAPAAIEVMREWRITQAESRLARGQGRQEPHGLVFPAMDGAPLHPDTVSITFARFVRACGLPPISLHGLRHTHASALIRGAVDITNVAARLGHSSPQITLRTYTHMFETADHTVSAVIEGMLKPGRDKHG